MSELSKEEKEIIAHNHFNTFKFDGLTVAETREICTLDYTYTQGFDRTDESHKRYKELSEKRIWK